MGSGRMAYGLHGTLQQEGLKEDDAQTMQGCIFHIHNSSINILICSVTER